MEIDVEGVQAVVDPLGRAKVAGDLIGKLHGIAADLGVVRRDAIEELLASGRTQSQVATDLGLTRARVGQILKAGPSPERLFLGTGTLTVVVAGKVESSRPDPQPVVAQDDLIAFDRLSALARTMGLDATFEVSPSGHHVRLNRDNLIILCGPRHSPNIREVLESDQVLGFAKDDQGWYLADQEAKTVYRSPMDSGEPRDIAYFARLPRPDGRGTFLYGAGIHAAGEAGIVHFLETSLPDLYREIRTRRFSMLIEATHDPETRACVASRQLTPTYRHEG